MEHEKMEFERTRTVPVDRLRPDRWSPRLIDEDDSASDEAIIACLYRAAELDELLQSIAANGYMDIEPLVVLHDPDPDASDSELIVLEGNRRLAALRLLREPELASRIKASEGVRIPIPPVVTRPKTRRLRGTSGWKGPRSGSRTIRIERPGQSGCGVLRVDAPAQCGRRPCRVVGDRALGSGGATVFVRHRYDPSQGNAGLDHRQYEGASLDNQAGLA